MNVKTFAERLREDRRLVLLRLLSEQRAYRSNSSILHAGLHHLGVSGTRDDVRTDLAWLQDQGLVRVQELHETSVVAVELTERGLEVTQGLAIVPGVARPSPR